METIAFVINRLRLGMEAADSLAKVRSVYNTSLCTHLIVHKINHISHVAPIVTGIGKTALNVCWLLSLLLNTTDAG